MSLRDGEQPSQRATFNLGENFVREGSSGARGSARADNFKAIKIREMVSMSTWKDDFLAMVRNRAFCLTLLLVGLFYLVGYMFILDPREHTISMIGLEHPWLFRLWGLVGAVTMVINNLYMMRRYAFKNRFCIFAMILGCVNIAVSVNVPTTDDWGWQLVVHWGTAIVFGTCMMIPGGLFLLVSAFKKKSRRALLTLIMVVPSSLALLTWLILDKGGVAQQGIMVFAISMLVLLNYTNAFSDCLPEGSGIEEAARLEEVEAR